MSDCEEEDVRMRNDNERVTVLSLWQYTRGACESAAKSFIWFDRRRMAIAELRAR